MTFKDKEVEGAEDMTYDMQQWCRYTRGLNEVKHTILCDEIF